MTAATATATTTAASAPKVKRSRKGKGKTEAPAPVVATIGGELKLAVAQEQLKRGLATVSHALSGKSTLPVLSNVLLASDGPTRLKLSATDLLIGITVSIPATVEQAGAITLPGKLLADLVGDLPNDTIALTMHEHTQSVTLACREFEANIKGIAAEEYPIIPAFTDSTPSASFSADALKRALAQVVFAASSDDTRPVLTGVRVALSGSTAAFTAADTFRVAFHDLALTSPVASAQEVVIPAPALATLRKLLGESDTPIEMLLRADGAMVLFRSKHLELITRVIDGTYPKTDKFRTNRPLTRLVMAKADLTRALKLAACFATASANVIRLELTPGSEGQGKLLIRANAAELGAGSSTHEAAVTGEHNQVALNVKFLADGIAACETAQVAIELTDERQPVLLRSVGSDSYCYVAMPMSIH